MSATQSIADTALGLTAAELQILRTQQQNIAQRAHQGAAADRGRGTSRHSQPSSRAASAASSQSLQGRVLLDPRSLQNLQVHLENVVRSVESRIDDVISLLLLTVTQSLMISRSKTQLIDRFKPVPVVPIGQSRLQMLRWPAYEGIWGRLTVSRRIVKE
jgi:hypothetical protein